MSPGDGLTCCSRRTHSSLETPRRDAPLISANTTIPTRKSETFSTASDNQPSVEIHVLQGDRSMAVDNRTVGRFHLDGIPPAPRGLPQVEVTFDIDADGILSVAARDKGTGKEQTIRIEASSGLTEQEIETMRKAAREHAAEDKQRREQADALNTGDALVFTERTEGLRRQDPGDKKAKIEAALDTEDSGARAAERAESRVRPGAHAAWPKRARTLQGSCRRIRCRRGEPQPTMLPTGPRQDADFESWTRRGRGRTEVTLVFQARTDAPADSFRGASCVSPTSPSTRAPMNRTTRPPWPAAAARPARSPPVRAPTSTAAESRAIWAAAASR